LFSNSTRRQIGAADVIQAWEMQISQSRQSTIFTANLQLTSIFLFHGYFEVSHGRSSTTRSISDKADHHN